MNSLKLFGALRPSSNFVTKRYALSAKDRILLFRKEIKSLYGPVINTKKPKRPKKLSEPSVQHEPVSTSSASSDGIPFKNRETNHESEMFWIIGKRWNQIVDESDTKPGNLPQTVKYKANQRQTSEIKSVKPKKLTDVESVNTSATPVIQKPIPLSNEELKNLLKFPLQSSVLSETPTDIRAPELRTLPSVGRVLQYTMTEAARSALLNWKLTKIRELGEQGFAELQRCESNQSKMRSSSLNKVSFQQT